MKLVYADIPVYISESLNIVKKKKESSLLLSVNLYKSIKHSVKCILTHKVKKKKRDSFLCTQYLCFARTAASMHCDFEPGLLLIATFRSTALFGLVTILLQQLVHFLWGLGQCSSIKQHVIKPAFGNFGCLENRHAAFVRRT